MDITGKRLLITGGTGALGEAVSVELAGAAARCLVTWIVPAEREQFQRDVLPRFDARLTLTREPVDVSDPEAAARVCQEAVEALGGLDALIHLVGGFAYAPVEDTDDATWERMHAMNLRSLFVMSRAAIPHLRASGGGKIVAVSARAGLRGDAGIGPYAAMKAGVRVLIESLAAELMADGIQANCVMPSIIDTPANRRSMGETDADSWVKPAEIARVIRFLASPAASVISGAAIPVYGRA